MLDFTMKHEGEPPARLLAQVSLKLREKRLPTYLASAIAPLMSAADELDEELSNELSAIVRFLNARGVNAEQAEETLKLAVEELVAEAESNLERFDSPEDGVGMKSSKQTALLRKLMLLHPQPGLNTTRPKLPLSSAQLRAGRGGVATISALSDALQARMDRRHAPTKGERYVGMSLGEMAMHCLRESGHRPMNLQEAVRMATHATSDFPLILQDALGKTIGRQMEQVTPALARAAHEVATQDYRGGNLLSLSASAMPREIGEGGEIKHVTIDEFGEAKPIPRDFGAMFRLSNKAIYNDDLGLFDDIGKQMVRGATERFRHVLLEPLLDLSGSGHLMSDLKPVFHADHRNLAPVGTSLNITSLSDARLALRSQRGKQGEYLAIEPWALVVPPQLETVAQQVVAEINATKMADVNPFSGALEIIVEVGLSDPKAWYLIGNPATTDGLGYSYLDGQKSPLVESKPGWDTLGTEFRLIWALDAKFVSYASWFKNPGPQ